MIASLTESDIARLEGSTGESVEWWYINSLLDSPGTELDGWALVATFPRFGSAIEEGRLLLVPPTTDGERINFGTGRLPRGSFQLDKTRAYVEVGVILFQGGYPSWSLAASGQSRDGRQIECALSFQAQIQPETLQHVGGQLKHFACYRVASEGSIAIDGVAIDVSGIGFYERAHGSLGWEPDEQDHHHVAGWNWYWSPRVGAQDAIVETWEFFASESAFSPFVSVSTDGEQFTHFTTGKRETLEERNFQDVSYPHKIRLYDTTETGDTLDLTITRRDVDARTLTAPGRPKRMYFVTGFSDFDGLAVVNGRKIDLTGPAFGSAYEMSSSW